MVTNIVTFIYPPSIRVLTAHTSARSPLQNTMLSTTVPQKANMQLIKLGVVSVYLWLFMLSPPPCNTGRWISRLDILLVPTPYSIRNT